MPIVCPFCGDILIMGDDFWDYEVCRRCKGGVYGHSHYRVRKVRKENAGRKTQGNQKRGRRHPLHLRKVRRRKR